MQKNSLEMIKTVIKEKVKMIKMRWKMIKMRRTMIGMRWKRMNW